MSRKISFFGYRDVWFGIITMGLAVALRLGIDAQPWAQRQFEGLVGPATLPRLLATCIFTLGLISFLIASFRYRTNLLKKEDDKMFPSEFFIIMIFGAMFPIILQYLGFLVASFLFIAGLSIYWRERRPVVVLAMALAVTAVTYAGSVYLLDIEFPTGKVWQLVSTAGWG